MILVVSDLHLGKDERGDSESLRQLIQCVEAVEPDQIIFLGDVFDAFIDSGSSPPAHVKKWAESVESLLERGCEVTYLMGNHDRWHRSYVENLVGKAPVRRSMFLTWAGALIQLEHGDFGPSHGGSTSFARWLSDQSWVLRLYMTLLPFGGAQALAAAVSRRFSSFDPNPAAVKALRDYAGKIVASSEAHGVIMGHCHQPGLFDLSEFKTGSWYLNSGDWYEHRSFIVLGEDAVARLCAWHDNAVVELDSLPVERTKREDSSES